MAVSSALNPGSIVKERSPSAEGAKNFLTGGSTLGSGIVAGAANKIVQFSRSSAAGVAAKPPDLQSMISTLSTNILNNVQNQVSSINQNVTQFVQQKLGEIQQNYRSRIDQIDAARPNSILNNFLSLYKEAIGYIQFLGNPRNVKTLRKNLVGLQKVFRETFKVARLIRSTIIKIVQQLSGLPQASTGPGGINLDINVPGGPLKKMMPRGVRRMLRNPAVMMGGAALAGGLGSRVVSGMLDAGDGRVDAAPMSEGTIPTALLDRFSGILDVFSQAIKNLSARAQSRQTQASSSGSSASPSPSSPDAPGAGPSGPSGPATPMADTTVSPEVDSTGLKSNFAPIAQDIINSGQVDTTSLKDRAAMGAFLAVAQMETNFPYERTYTSRGGTDNMMQGPVQLNRYVHPASAFQSKESYLNYTLPKFKGESSTFTGAKAFNPLIFAQQLQSATTGWEVAQALRSGGFSHYDFDPLDTPEESNRLTRDQVEAIKKLVFGSMNLRPTSPTVTAPGVAAAPNQAQGNQAAAQSVAQPPGRPPVETAVVPLSTNDQSSQSTPPVNKSSPPPKLASQGADSVPFFTASNDDNFLSLYSRLTYNIVDG